MTHFFSVISDVQQLLGLPVAAAETFEYCGR